eukprot:TRINITY_DN13107_c1_g2_i1.p1 TRINITY_DN13107_c1_g2~~TRINITY_DN13107_c1_g2_i1.p1  ORF type:complete len:1365 (-),score=418.25 TRINITY_DN13107_c1_g2_i1:57-4115(-)
MGTGASTAQGVKYKESEEQPAGNVVSVKPRTETSVSNVRVTTVTAKPARQQGSVFAAAFDQVFEEAKEEEIQWRTRASETKSTETQSSAATTADDQASERLVAAGNRASAPLGAALRGRQSTPTQDTAGGGGAVSSSKPSGANAGAPEASPEPVHLQSNVRQGSDGSFQAGQRVYLTGLNSAKELNGQKATIVRWDPVSSRWVVRVLSTGEDKRIRLANLSASPPEGTSVAATAEKELEAALLQSNWSAIYQLFYERFGVESLGRLDRGYAVKAAVEMSLSIISKCFALLRSDPHGRLHCTPLHIAALQSSTEAAEVIVRDSPQTVESTHKASSSSLCPLHIAVLCGSHAVVELLLDAKANPNVRTIHDICPLHLAATTSKELCQLLMAFGAEPGHKDVMGSNALHYATAFKQHDTLEVLLSSPQAQRLASEGDQKRVTPLHVSCALYTSLQDLVGPMLLLGAGAKPWQTDVSGASAREVVPYAHDSDLMRFFEGCGDNAKVAAQEWLEDFLFGRGDGKDDDPWEEAEAAVRKGSEDDGERQPGVRAPSAQGPQSAGSQPPDKVMTEELERLRSELAESQKRCAELEPLAKQLQHSQEKVAMLEQAARNTQQVFDAQKELMDSARNQYQVQLQELKERHTADKESWEERSHAQLEVKLREVRQEEQRQAEAQQREAELRLAELQAQLQQAEQAAQQASHRAELAQQAAQQAAHQASNRAEMAKTRTLQLGSWIKKPSFEELEEDRQKEQQEAEEKHEELQQLTKLQEQQLSEMQEQVEELQEEVSRLTAVSEQERCSAEQLAQQAQDFKSAARTLCAKYGIHWTEEASSGLQSLMPVDEELARLQSIGTGKDDDVKAMAQQVMELKDEVASLRLAKLEADDKCAQLQVDYQQAENAVNAKALQLEAQLQDIELQHSQAIDQAHSDLETCQKRAEAAEAQALSMQPAVDRLTAQLTQLQAQFMEEQLIRKKYHNQIQDMKGNIRVFCRFRPLVPKEQQNGDANVLRKVDAFTVDLQRPAPHNDSRKFDFDSVFAGSSTQEEIFSDCRDLVQSAVDGYNVTIFAYGQTGAGKTHTMYGNSADPGLAPRSIDSLFAVIDREQKRGQKTFRVKAYMIELYKQDIIDLLIDSKQREQKSLQVKKDVGRGIMFVEGVSERQISSPEELKAVLAEGERRRHTGSTKMNASSSRSHLLLSIIIEASVKDTEQVIYGKITLCDLAGSERPKKSDVSGDQLKEAIEINKSLTALGDVIEALSKGNKNIPYRNHKLTMLMQDSLGGSAKTLMFVNCSPASSNCEETLMSLKWATRAKEVTNDVKRNADSKEVARLKQVIALMSAAQSVQEEPSAKDVAAGMVS